MAIVQGYTATFLRDLLLGKHNFNSVGGHTFKVALYTSSVTLSAATTDYSATNEVSGAGYTAGGQTLTCNGVTISGTTAFVDFANASWPASSITARGALIYNTTTDGGVATTDAVMVLDFGSNRTSAPNFTLIFPSPDATNAIVRLT